MDKLLFPQRTDLAVLNQAVLSIHNEIKKSSRCRGRFVAIECSSMDPLTLLQSPLF